MSLIQHSQRSLRKPCNKCGKCEGLYWGHDTERTGYKPCNEKACVGYGQRHIWVLIEKDYNGFKRHECLKSEPSPVIPDEPKPAFEVVAEIPAAPKAVATDEANAIEVLRRVLGAQVDAEQVRSIVTEELGKIGQQPVRVTIHDARTSEEHELPDVAHSVLPTVLKLLDIGEHVWLVGPAGTGKSTIAQQCAESLKLEFGAISLAPNTPLSEITGYLDATGNYVRTVFRERYEHGGVFLFDEVDNGHPSTLAKINMALANGHMAFPDGMVERHPDFRCVAAANTFGTGPDRSYVGRQQIDAATLDRFATVYVPVDEALELALALAQGAEANQVHRLIQYVRDCRKNVDTHKLPVVISPRASIMGARCLAAGFNTAEVVAMRIRKGMTDQDWSKVNPGYVP